METLRAESIDTHLIGVQIEDHYVREGLTNVFLILIPIWVLFRALPTDYQDLRRADRPHERVATSCESLSNDPKPFLLCLAGVEHLDCADQATKTHTTKDVHRRAKRCATMIIPFLVHLGPIFLQSVGL